VVFDRPTLLFGSVARGEADRASDIDLQVIIDGKLTKARRDIGEIRQEVEKQKFDGDRYELQVLVESVKSAESYGEKLREIFNEGIRLRETEKLEEVQEAVFDG
jgi:predicted nucleotidyltransferase